MSADVLWRAVSLMRENADDSPNVSWRARGWNRGVAHTVADWLELTASTWDEVTDLTRDHAVRVACAYLGEPS